MFTHKLMFKDEVVAKINVKDGSVELCGTPIPMNFTCKEAESIEDRVANVTAFKEWCAGRTLMMSQKHAKKICNSLNLSQDISIDNKAQIALAYHCSTLTDCYWVQKDDEGLLYSEISLFINASHNVLTPVSLKGEVSSIFNQKLKNWSDIGTDGTLAKSWVRENNKYFLLKNGDNIEGEVLASKVNQMLGLNTVIYSERMYDDLPVSCSECFTSEKYSFIPFRTYLKKYGKEAIDNVKSNYLSDYADLAVSTYLTGNEDLHSGNWGFRFDNESKEIVGISPLYDFDGCFVTYNTSKNLKFLPEVVYITEDGETPVLSSDFDDEFEMKGPTIEEAALSLAEYSTANFKNIDYSVIPEKFRDEFAKRVSILEKQKELAEKIYPEEDLEVSNTIRIPNIKPVPRVENIEK